MGPGLRKTILTLHVLSSVGWLGAVTAFLSLAIAGLGTDDRQVVAAVYPAAQIVTWWVIVPFAFLSLASGVVAALGTNWGLLRHYWVLIKLILTVASLVVLLVHTGLIDQAAETAGQEATSHPSTVPASVRLQMVVQSAAALGVLATATILSTVKPRGLTPFAFRRGRASTATGGPRR